MQASHKVAFGIVLLTLIASTIFMFPSENYQSLTIG